MRNLFRALLKDAARNTRSKIFSIYGILVVMVFQHYPVLLGTAFLATALVLFRRR